MGPTRRRGGTRPSVNKEEQEIEQAALIGSATTRILDARSVAALKAAAGKGQELRLPEGIDVERLSRAADMERILFRDVHLSQVPEPTSDEQNGAPLRCPSSTELEAAAHAMAASISFRRLATALKHGLIDPEIAAEAMAHVRAAARLFEIFSGCSAGRSPSRGHVAHGVSVRGDLRAHARGHRAGSREPRS